MGLCVCDLFQRIETRTRLLLVIHRAELRKPTNTGLLATACLPNSEVHVRGNEGEPTVAFDFGDTQPLLLYPYEGARVLERGERPATLIVPDGNWRQAAKVRARVPGLEQVPCVTLPPGPPSTYRLRSEAHAHGLATVEAIARAFDVLEGPHVREALERVFHAMVERTLWVRGTITEAEVRGGLPHRASRHEPRGAEGP